MASIIEVARRANVSITTVSRVLSGSPHPVSEATRERVLAAAHDLNYAPSALAQAMVRGGTRTVGVIVGDSTDPYFAAIVRGVEDVARASGYMVFVCNSDRVFDVEIEYLRTLDSYRVDGVIFAGGGLNDPDYLDLIQDGLKRLRERNAAVVTLGTHYFDSLTVRVDNEQALQDAVCYLVGLGHRQIAYIDGPPELTTSHLRMAGFRKGLETCNLAEGDPPVIAGDYTYESGLAAAEVIMGLPSLPDVILASNDLMGIGCLIGLKRQGLRIPDDLSIMGIDDIVPTRYVDPPLTTVHFPLQELGAQAMQEILSFRQGRPASVSSVVLPYQIIERGSVAAKH